MRQIVLESGHVVPPNMRPDGVGGFPRGLFVAIEGVDGSGKTVLSRKLVAKLNEIGEHCVLTREPFDRADFDSRPWTSSEFIADRHNHVRDFIKPHIMAGIHVISDRYAGSQFAYQRVPWPVACPYEPDLTLLMATPIELCRERVLSRGESFDGLDEVFARYALLEERTRVEWVTNVSEALAAIQRLLT